jgi:hypothetical protein
MKPFFALSRQLKAKKLTTKLFLRHALHAKLYLIHCHDPNISIICFLGSSNLTLPGLAKQGKLNVDIPDYHACMKLQPWFNDRSLTIAARLRLYQYLARTC